MTLEEANRKIELKNIELNNIIREINKSKIMIEHYNRIYNNLKEEAETVYYQLEQLEEVKYALTGEKNI